MNKKILLFLSSVLCLVTFAFPQNVGIGTNNPQNKLHVAGGLRVDTLVGVGGAGILIHNSVGAVYGLKFSGDVNDVLHGDGTFGAIGSGGSSSNVWMLNGNSGTNPATDFLGTTDAQPLKFRVKNQPAGIIDSSNANTALGFKSLSLMSGSSNTAIGMTALFSNTTGAVNTAIGYEALISNTSGNQNTATGGGALNSNSTGSNNTANGLSALGSNTTGSNNTAAGSEALLINTTGYDNTAIGVQCLYVNSSGYGNTASGFKSLYSNTTGTYNVASGSGALYLNTTGGANVAIGLDAMINNTSGNDNTAVGLYALQSNTAGLGNVAYGGYSLISTNASDYNTALGFHAGDSYNMGWNNTLVGAFCNVNANDIYNCIALGEDVICTAANQARIGNSSTTSIGGQVGWTTLSDERMKKNIQENVKGLEFIKLLRPVTYNIDANKVEGWLTKDIPEKNKNISSQSKEIISKASNEKSKIVYTGFIAQDVEKAAKQIGYDFSGVDAPKNEKDLYGLRYAEFVVPLVKAVQEQQQQIDELKKQNELLLKRIEKLESTSYTNK